jgi:hypothetical protein
VLAQVTTPEQAINLALIECSGSVGDRVRSQSVTVSIKQFGG